MITTNGLENFPEFEPFLRIAKDLLALILLKPPQTQGNLNLLASFTSLERTEPLGKLSTRRVFPKIRKLDRSNLILTFPNPMLR